MRIGIDLDGTLYAYPRFFGELIRAMHARGHTWHCTSCHGIDRWHAEDVARLTALGVPVELIDPSLLAPHDHCDLTVKGRACDQVDYVFDDNLELPKFTKTPIIAPLVPNPLYVSPNG